jgi:hypothetical protein
MTTIRTLNGHKFSTYLADLFVIDAMDKAGKVERSVAEAEVLRCFDAMDRMISGEFDPLVEPTLSPAPSPA